ncbi:MAG: hypothetical protein KGL55_04925, partial [Rhodospirillales bacterium]|nr:hypothetical protein [Rhodospirillales bacterium]
MTLLALAILLSAIAALASLAALLRSFRASPDSAVLQQLRLLAEQGMAGQRSEAATLRASLEGTERALTASASTAGAQLRLEVNGAI